MNSFDRSKLNDYADRMLDQFLTAFPKETIYSLEHSDDYYVPDKERFVGAWVIEWLCPAGGYDWNVVLSSSERQLTICWGGSHEHFVNWSRIENDPEATECLTRLAEIFTEKIWHVYQGSKQPYGRWCEPNEIEAFVQSEQATMYEIKSWLGTFDRVVCRDEKR